MKIQSTTAKEDLQKRLRRIEGQTRGVQKMLADDRECQEIMQQLKAIQAAVKNATSIFMRAYAKECLLEANNTEKQELIIDEIMDLMSKA